MQKIKLCLMVCVLVIPGLILAKRHHLIHYPHKKQYKKHVPKKTIFQVTESDLKFSGYFDGSYNYLHRSNQFTTGAFNRVYDIQTNGVSLQQLNLTWAYQPKNGWGGLINPLIGQDAFTVAPYGWNPDFGNHNLGFALPQAFIQYAAGKFTWMLGSFLSLAGAESLNSSTNIYR